MKKLLIVSVFAAVAASTVQVAAAGPRHMPHGARICHECGGDGRVRCGFLYFDSKRCLRCDGRGFLLPKPPPPPKQHHVARPHDVPHKPGARKPAPPPKKSMPPPKGGKGPR